MNESYRFVNSSFIFDITKRFIFLAPEHVLITIYIKATGVNSIYKAQIAAT